MGLGERIVEVERQVAEQREAVAAATARLRGLEAELDSLRRSAEVRSGLAEMDRTDAIEAVLREAPGALTVPEVVERLVAARRVNENSNSVSATLSYLLKMERVTRVARGRYSPA